MKILLDSTMLIAALRKDPVSVVQLTNLLRAGHEMVTSTVNVGEIYSGSRAQEQTAVEELFQLVEAYPVSISIAKRGGELRNAAARKGRTLKLDDMLVAATALEFGFPVITDNVKDFKGTGVRFYGAGEN